MSALDELIQEANDVEQKEMEAAGIAEQYSAWRESMPDERIPDEAVKQTFLWAQDMEDSAVSGTLDVASGGALVPPATDIPAPSGEDDDGTGAGDDDVSEGGDEPEPIEGLWQPPPESEAENYVEPTTDEIIQSSDWSENAEIFYDFMGKPNFSSRDNTVGEWARSQVGMFNWNLMVTTATAARIMLANDPKVALAYLNLLNMYDHSDGGAREFGFALLGMATDPVTYAGLGVGKLAARGAAKATAKAGFKRAAQFAIVGGTAGIIEGGAIAGGFDLVKQNVEQEAGVREDIDKGRVAKATGFGMGLGMTLGAGAGHLVGRYSDRFARAAEKELTRQLGGSTAAEIKAADAPFVSVNMVKWLNGKMKHGWGVYRYDKLVDVVPTEGEARRLLKTGGPDEMDFASEMPALDDLPVEQRPEWLDDAARSGMYDPPSASERDSSGQVWQQLPKLGRHQHAPDSPKIDVPMSESEKLAEKLSTQAELEAGGTIIKTADRPGSIVRDLSTNKQYELIGRTKNGWFRAVSKQTGEEINLRRNAFDVVEVSPRPDKAGPMELDPFSDSAAKIIAMAERISSSKLVSRVITHAEQAGLVEDLKKLGVNITAKGENTYWTPSELMFLRDTYNAQANGMAELSQQLSTKIDMEGRLLDSDLAHFNEAHAQFMATRELFFGTSGNAARQLNILRTRPTDEIYQFSQSLLDSISMQGGRNNTERAIKLMSDSAKRGGKNGAAKISKSIWDSRIASTLLNVRYNFMLSSWRTHFFNFLGNSASGIYHHLLVSPIGGVINNATYAGQLAYSKIPGSKFTPNPAERYTMKTWGAELRGHYRSAMDSYYLAKEIAMGRDIGEGKVWNELGLRYDVVNVPRSGWGKAGTTPVRMLEAGDAFFKNQYYNSRMHSQADHKARYDEIYHDMDYKKRYDWWLENPDATMEKNAKAFAAKMTYTNDPEIYGGVLAAVARGVSHAQSRSLAVNMIIPFVRTPANLLSFSAEMMGANVILSFPKTYRSIMQGAPLERQEALSRITVAAGMMLLFKELHENGSISGAGPPNWEERQVWEAAGWQANSIKIWGNWVDISRAQPAGLSIASLATFYDYMSLNVTDEPMTEWIGGSLLSIADMILDESYLSTVADVVSAIQSKQGGRGRSIAASTINSVLVPNLLRDFRRGADPTKRSLTSQDLMGQIVKQVKNATPGLSDEVAPNRDWKGDVKNYYGNVYTRSLIPFNVRDPEDTDPASMALAYARVPPSVPNKKISMPGMGNFIDLLAMDNGDAFVYDKYKEIVGKARHEAVNTVMDHRLWKGLVESDNIGPGSEGDTILRKAIAIGSQVGRLRMIEFLINHSEGNNTFKRANGDTVMIHHTFSIEQYRDLLIAVRLENIPVPEGQPQYKLREREEGPEFFKP